MKDALWYLQDPSYHLVLLILASAAAAECMVAIQAGKSRRHWFIGALAIWGSLALLVPIRAFEPMWLFLITLPLIAVTLRLTRQRQSKREQSPGNATERQIWARLYSFGTRDLLLLMLLVAISLAAFPAAMRQYRPDNWVGWIVSAVTLASVAVLAAVIVAGPRRRLAAWILLALLPAAANAMMLTLDDSWMELWQCLGISKAPGMLAGNIVLLMLFASELAAILIVLLALVQASVAGRSARRLAVCRTALTAVVLAFVMPLSFVYVRLSRQVPQPPQLTVDNNQYDRILTIGRQMLKTQAAARLDIHYSELQTLLAGTSAVEYAPERDSDTSILADNQSFRELARCLDAESEALIAQGENDYAADYALATTQLGAILQRGGHIEHVMNGINHEMTGYLRLAELRGGLSPAKADRVRAVLAKIASEREVREMRVARATAERNRFPWHSRLWGLVVEMRGKAWSFELVLDQNETMHRLLQADLAIRSFFRDHGEFPAELCDLVPEYLPQELIDSHSVQPLMYRSREPEFTLYSVGWDGRDNGGKFASYNSYRNEPGWDLDLDTWTRPPPRDPDR